MASELAIAHRRIQAYPPTGVGYLQTRRTRSIQLSNQGESKVVKLQLMNGSAEEQYTLKEGDQFFIGGYQSACNIQLSSTDDEHTYAILKLENNKLFLKFINAEGKINYNSQGAEMDRWILINDPCVVSIYGEIEVDISFQLPKPRLLAVSSNQRRVRV